MSSVKASAARNLMVVGRLLICLLISQQAYAGEIENPRFFSYRAGSFTNNLVDITFGWFKTLDKEQKAAYNQSITHAVMFAENGQEVSWYMNDASGRSVPVMTWPTGNGYCRRIYIQAIAYNTEKTMQATACFENSSDNWRWIRE